MKTEDEIIINKKTASMLGLPKLSMDVMAKIYLAMAVKSVDKMTYVYTLACLKSGEKYNLWPMTEIAAFDDEKEASIYHKTVKQVMAVQSKHKGIQTLREMLADKIKEFNELVR